jgi:hypothetical protein
METGHSWIWQVRARSEKKNYWDVHHLFPSVMALGKKAKKLKRPCNFIPQSQTMAYEHEPFFWRAAVKIFSIQSVRGENCNISKQTPNTPPPRAQVKLAPALCFFTVRMVLLCIKCFNCSRRAADAR